MPSRRLTRALGFVLGAALAVPAGAIGFGTVPGSVGFGRPLDVAVPLRLAAGEAGPAGCLHADVADGERRLPPEVVAVRYEPSAEGGVVRVRTAVALHEPVIEVGLTVGCAPSVSRRFTFFAEPAAAALPALADSAPSGGLGSNPARPAAAPAGHALPAPGAAAPAVRRAAAVPPSVPTRAWTTTAAPAAARPATGRPAAADDRPAPGVRRARLELDGPAVAQPAPALGMARPDTAPAKAAQVGSAAEAAASAAQVQLAALQARLQALHADAAADRQSIGRLQEQLARAEARGPWPPWGWGLIAALALTATGQGWRLRRLQRRQVAASGPQRVDPPGAAFAALAPADDALGDGARAAVAGPPTAVPSATTETLTEHSAPRRGAAGPAWVSAGVDELIDLEQQAEFFVVIGDEASAIELLLACQRQRGGASPLPHLKLLEIYRRRGDHEALDRARSGFRQRFQVDPPIGDGDVDAGLGLLDHPQVVDALQRAWPAPIEAMALLEDLLFRRGRGAVLDLPSYRDALLLYGVARDVMRQGGAGAAPVDLLLPLTAGAERGAEMPYITAAQPSRALPPAGLPIDLDLGEIAGIAGPARPPAAPPRPA
jgi:hypothetical protein